MRLRRPRPARRPLARALVGIALVGGLAALPTVPAAGAEATFTFLGGGYGHSVGMSQYGAYGMALEGYSWEQILTHYFTGSSPADIDPALAAAPLWLGLTQEITRIDLVVRATGPAPTVPVTFTQGAASITAAADERVVVEHLGGTTCRVSGPGGTMEGTCSIDAAWDGATPAPTTALEVVGCTLPDWNAPGGTVYRPCRYAFGSLHIRPDNNTATFDVALEIGVEPYVLGISESPYYWGSNGGMAALQAQAVASRSYALHRAVLRGDPASRPWCWCHIVDSSLDQFYVGWGHTTAPWAEAVASTAGKVMTHPADTRNGALIPIETFFSSSTFGWTEDSENGFYAYVPYLRAVDDHWGRSPAAGNPYGRWTRSFTASDLAARLGMSSVTEATISRCSATGAALAITFTGGGGPQTFTTRDLRGRLGLRSMQVYNVGAPPPAVPPCPGPALDPVAPGGPVTLAGLSLDDDAIGDSRGDGDGLAECGEVVEAFTTITNQGPPLAQIGSTLSSTDPYVTIRWNTLAPFPNLAQGASAANTEDWDLTISPDAPPGYTAHLNLQVTSGNGGPWDLDVAVPVTCGPLPPGGPVVVSGIAIDDDALGDSRGDADALAECGETVELLTAVANLGPTLQGVWASLASTDPYVTITGNTVSVFPTIPPGGAAFGADDWELAVAPGAPPGYTAQLSLEVTAANGGPWSLPVALPVTCAPKPTVLASLLAAEGLRRGARGAAVRELQGFLAVKGYWIRIDGSFGPATESTLRTFQYRNRVRVDGIVGPATLAVISRLIAEPGFAWMADPNGRVVSLGSRGADVAELQRFLAARGYRVGRIDGIFGSMTLGAVRAFQSRAGLPADGQVAWTTRLALLRAFYLVGAQ